MKKDQRQFIIKDIIGKMEITSQERLVKEVKRRGAHVTQATLSRDLKEIGAVRVPSTNGMRYTVGAESKKLKRAVGIEILAVLANETTLLVKTIPGGAHTVGSYIDGLHRPDILGTVAGDDTLIVVPSSVKSTAGLLSSINELMTEE
ncbi:MAG: arginine repressor [Ignavibacteriales bacterium CG07_land_8_20_14_0_80_59_12]|jgi:transcriptional regulator of arginine metabolism|nr:MAG: arginine repressor [Ignavibacteriales bacterium CG07_land_8_20_14_0_80_59_12]